MSDKIGRFEIRRELGRGAQSIVYLAFDPHLEREVALKTMHFGEASKEQNQSLLAEARMVSRLRHPGIVPIFEAGEEDGDPYLVFEYVSGDSLAGLLRKRPVLPALEAAQMALRIVTAVAAAHAEGVIHRDLKPSNVLIDAEGLPRVMDFGIACRVSGLQDGLHDFSGTPAYMAPEYILRREVNERTDVFAAGLLLIEMLTGKRVFGGNDAQQVMQRISAEDAALPEGAAVDDRMAGIALRAVARDPQARYRDLVEFQRALEDYLKPAEGVASTESGQSTLDFLLRRMRHKSDFPALSESVTAINRIATSDSDSINKLSTFLLRDFALTNKLLRLVNSVHYRPAGGGNISTVSRAVMVIGFDAVRNLAITVLLFEHLQNKENASQLKEEFLRANLAGTLARDIATRKRSRNLEQAFICSIFHNLGRLLVQFYFPDESEEIRREMLQSDCSEMIATQRVLGISYEELGVGIARNWGFPSLIVDSMRSPPAGPVRKPNTPEEHLRALSGFSNEVCSALAFLAPAARERELKKISARFGDALPVSERELKEAIEASIIEITDFARVIRVNLGQTQIGKQLRKYAHPVSAEEEAREAMESDSSDEDLGVLGNTNPALATANFSEQGTKAADAQAVLAAGIQDISNTLVEEYKLNDLLRIILETMYRAMGFQHVLLCIKDARSKTMQGRFGLGPQINEIARGFKFSLNFTPDIFHVATTKGVDIQITDIDDPKIAERIPDWYRKLVSAKTFVLLPLIIKGAPVALIYADKERANEIVISEKELSLLRTLRNQAVLAIKQAS